MAKMRYWLSLGYRLLALGITGAVIWLQFDALGLNAWRILETWVIVAAAGYFFWSALVSWFRRKQPQPQPATCPLLQGFVLVAGVGLFILRLVYQQYQLTWLGTQDIVVWLEILLVPALVLCDWLCFTKKGSWSMSYPWYWLGTIISYCCIILLTASLMPAQSDWTYPYTFLDYQRLGIDNLLRCSVLIIVVVLLTGYVFMLLDYVLSGQLGKHIVLPRIKTIVIEEPLVVEPEAPTPAEEAQLRIAQVPKSKPEPETQPVKKSQSARTHQPSKSKTKIIADIRSQVTGSKGSKTRSRPSSKPKPVKKP